MNAFAPCKVAENAVNQIIKSKEVQDYLRENREFIEKVGQVTGSFKSYNESSTLWNLTDIVDTVMAEMENGKNITEFKYKFGKFNQTVFDKLNEILLKSFKWEYSTKQVQRLRAGQLLGELLKNMNNVKDGKENI